MTPSELFFGTSGPRNAPIAIVGEAWGEEEQFQFQPFVGPAGTLLNSMLSEAGINRSDCFVTNIVPSRPDQNKLWKLFDISATPVAFLRPGPVVTAGLERLYAQLAEVKPRLVIGCGNYPLWALSNAAGSTRNPDTSKLTGPLPEVPSGIGAYRGSQLYTLRHWSRDRSPSTTPFLPIFHPAGILRDWASRPVTVHDLRSRVPLALSGRWERLRPYEFCHRPSFDRLVGQLSTWLYSRASTALACDIETTLARFITCIGLADSADRAICVPFIRDAKTFDPYWSPREEGIIRKLLSCLFEAPHVKWIGQNFVYDMAFLREEFGGEPRLDFDTLVAQNLLFPGSQKDLGYLSSLYCDHHRYWKDDNRDWDSTGTLDQHLLYNCEDAARTFEISAALQAHLKTTHLDHLWGFERFKIDLANRMTSTGVLIDRDARKDVGLDLINQRSSLADWLLACVPQKLSETGSDKFWFDSSQQTATIFYDLLGFKTQFDRKTKSRSTGDESVNVLKELYPHFADFFQALLDYRSLKVLYSTFIQSQLEPSGRFSASFNPAGTITFRWSSSKNAFRRGGNAQNIPAGGDE